VSASVQTEPDLRKAFSVEEARYQKLRTLLEGPDRTPPWERKSGGRTVKDDIRANVLRPDIVAHIDGLRDELTHQLGAGELDMAQATLQALTQALEKEVTTY